MRDADVTLFVAVTRAHPEASGVGVELNGVDVADGPRRNSKALCQVLPSSALFHMQMGRAASSVLYSPK